LFPLHGKLIPELSVCFLRYTNCHLSFMTRESILLLFTVFKKHFKDLSNIHVVKALCKSLLKAWDVTFFRAETIYLEVFIFIRTQGKSGVPLWP
jgi:hypothetical protein